MRRALGLGLMLAAMSAFVCLHAHGQTPIYDCYNGSAEQGGNRTTTNGIQSLQYVQQSFPGATVTVYQHSTTNKATLFQDDAGTIPLTNPFTASNHGVAFVCAADGRYDFQYSNGGILVPFTVSDIKFCFNCSGGGGGSVGPGTINQVAKFTSTNNVGNSSGFDDGTNVVQWPNGLTVNNSGYAKQRPNGANCTANNLLVEYDGNVVGGLSSVQTAVLGSQHVVGVAGQGAGCTGNVQITDHAFHTCTFDNQTVIHDAVIASNTTPGYCSDGGATVQGTQVVGRVASLNTGSGTLAVVDFFTGDTAQAAGTITTCATAGSNAYYPGIGQVVSCDPQIVDDGQGGLTFTNTTRAGNYYQTQGPVPAGPPANAVMEFAPTSVTAYSEQRPGSIGTVGQTRVISSIGTDSNGNPIAVETWGTAGGGTAPQASNPSAPVLTTNGSAGSTQYCYKVVGLEDGPTGAYHSAASSQTCIATGNATLTSSNSINLKTYADTLYGYRCYNIYRTSSAGTPATTGLIATCVWKSFIDTGLAGDSSTPPSTNTTVLDANGLTIPLPGCNSIPKAPPGIDGPPCSPNAANDEFSYTFGAPGDANSPFWTLAGTSTSSAVSLSNGLLVLDATKTSGGTGLHCLLQPVPASTPWTFVTTGWDNPGGTHSNDAETGIGLFETSSGKYSTYMNDNSGSGYFGIVRHWSNVTTNVNIKVGNNQEMVANGFYLGIRNDGTTLHYQTSWDGINYIDFYSEAITTAFTTAPSSVGLCYNNGSTGFVASYDYWRRTQ